MNPKANCPSIALYGFRPINIREINELLAEASGGRTHLRHKVPHAGFEDQAQHRPRIASREILAGLRGCTGLLRARQPELSRALLHGLDAEFDVLIELDA